MPTYIPPKKNTELIFYMGLVSQSTGQFQANPTLASGDVKVATDDGAPANIGTLPAVDADFTKRVKVTLSASEMNGDNVTVIFSDAAGAEWDDAIVNIQTSANQIDDIIADTNDIQSRLPAALTADGNIKADVLGISGDLTAADNAEAFFDGTGYAGTNNTIPTVTTVTNLTNAPTNGDLTATMKASINAEADTALADYGALKPTTAGRTLDVTTTGEAGIDWANIGGATTTQNLSGTTVKTATDVETDTADIQTRLPAALVSGRMDSSVGAMANNTLTAAALATDAVTEIQSGLATSAVDINRILDRVDYQRGHHTVTGNTYYVDGVGGNDTTGTGTRAAPYKTISKALTVCTSNNHDEIILLPNSSGGPTTITETATISVTKNYVQIRGPGRDALVTVTAGANKDVFSITANGVGMSGFRIATNGASSNGVTVSSAADFVLLSRLWIENASQDAIQFNVANRCEVSDCVIVASGRDGVRVSSGSGSGTYNLILRNVIRDSVGSAVNLQGSDASDCRIQHNVIRDNAVGVTIAAGVVDTVLTDNRFVNNTTEISDSGTRTLQQWNYLSTDTNGRVDVIKVAGTTQTAGDIIGDTNDIQSRLPAALVSGRMDSNMQAAANGVITAAVIATDAIDADAIAASAVTEIQSGLATSAALANVQADTDNIQTRLPAALSGDGFIKADLKSIDDELTSGNNATLKLRRLSIAASGNETAVSFLGGAAGGKGMEITSQTNNYGLEIVSDLGVAVGIEGAQGAVNLFSTEFEVVYIQNNDPNYAAVGINGAKSGIDINATLGKSINAPQDIALPSGDLDDQLQTIDNLIDTEVAAIKSKTDQLTFTNANQVDANIQAVNDTNITGDGSGTPWGPA